ncbi:DUF6090 family protein [Polaribacter marinivivus]|uniref:DUF6090 family protein n=1 Tax=Polaribacter marinivivus TaxID=1524260 RepID=A0ABV8RCP2_9FLAO
MIKFFRKIRQKLLVDNRFNKYLLYAIGEIILVVIGILIALQINNWNTNRIEKNKNKELLIKLTKELDYNIQRAHFIDTVQGGFQTRKIYTDSILSLIVKGIQPEDLNYLTKEAIFYVNTFNLNSTVFQELKNTGSLYSLGTDSLVTQIQTYYQLCERESFYNLQYSEECIYLRRQCYDGFINFRQLYHLDAKTAIKDNPWIFNSKSKKTIHLRQYASRVSNQSNLMSYKLKNIMVESKKLKELIAKELNSYD